MNSHRLINAAYVIFLFFGLVYFDMDHVIYFMGVVSAVFYAKWINEEDRIRDFNREMEEVLKSG